MSSASEQANSGGANTGANAEANPDHNEPSNAGANPAPSLNYREYRFVLQDPALSEALLGLLSDLPFEAFEETAEGWLAWVPGSVWSTPDAEADLAAALLSVNSIIPHQVQFRVIETENWNALWEANFPPVDVSPRTAIRAPFHQPFGDRDIELIIEPKMSFGTGHHATTRLVLRLMENEDLAGKSVFDLGTGTGVLAIYAALKGAGPVWGVDNHAWSVANARENATRNGVPQIEITEGTVELLEGKKTDFVLANINRPILLASMEAFRRALQPGGVLLLSGLLQADESAIREAARTHNLHFSVTTSEDQWIAIRFTA
ncbi:MAG: 50S ribosomal protein L11 methyltransferase [Bacteroidetes bacterium]|nr:50S ribosomal protein L11 methyltransferase [Bacteroidota bacterium]